MTATTETLEQIVEPGSPSAWLRFGLAFALGLAVALLVGAGVLLAYDQQFAGKVLPGVRVGSVDLSGLTPEAAHAELQRAYGSLSDGRIVLTGIEDQQVITYAEVGRGPDVDGLVATALAVGRTGSPLDRAVADVRTAVRGVVLDPASTFDAEALATRVGQIAEGLRIDPVDSTVVIGAAQEFVVVPGHVGREADPTPVIVSLTAVLAQVDAPAEINANLGVHVLEAEVTAAEAFEAKRTAERMTREILVVVGEEQLSIAESELRGWVSFDKTPAGGYEAVMDTAPLTGLVEAMAKEIDREPVSATFVTTSGLVTDIVPSQDGYRLSLIHI